jgi:hypothetical protein
MWTATTAPGSCLMDSKFTDDDLKRLKEMCDSMDGKFESWNFVEKDGASIKALLARLEAAEKVCYYVENATDDELIPDAIEAWRKAAGK